MDKFEETTKLQPNSKLSKRIILCYGVGHMLNDLTASMWFSYLLIFFHFILKFNSSACGLLLLIGQVVDGISTPIIGILSDKGAGYWMCKYGHRKSWHLMGTLFIATTFPFIFSPIFAMEHGGMTAKICYYSFFIVIFQIGWASVQVSHLSLAPDLTMDQHERTSLLTARYSFTVISNIIVHLFTWFMFLHNGHSDVVGEGDGSKFQVVALFAVALGCVVSLIFHLGVNEKTVNNDDNIKENTTKIKKKTVLKNFGLYHIMGVYMMSQLYVNQSQVFIPLYLEEYLHIEAQRLPILPLIMYISSSLTSFLTQVLNTHCGRKSAYIIGSILAVLVSIFVYFGHGDVYKSTMIYGVIAIFGCASSILSVTSLGITADLIGQHTTQGAFVYGLMSFADKISNGVAVMIIQYLRHKYHPTDYYRNMLICMCGGSAAFGTVIVIFLPRDFKLTEKGVEVEKNIETAPNIVYCYENETGETES